MAKNRLEFFSRYNPPTSPSLHFSKVSLTRQEFADEADINKIMEKYAKGLAPIPSGARVPQYGDYSSVPDYASAFEVINKAQTMFDALPSDVRRRFDNDPQMLFDFMRDPGNLDEAVKLGLIMPSKPSEASSKPSEASSDDNKGAGA